MMEIDPEKDAILLRRRAGLDDLLARAGPAEVGTVEGLAGPDGRWMDRAYVEFYLRREADALRQEEVQDRRWTRSMAVGALIISLLALVVSIVNWLLPVKTGG
jgi:hypothetical protein